MREIVSIRRNSDGEQVVLSSKDVLTRALEESKEVMILALEVYLDRIIESGNEGDWARDELWMIPEMIKDLKDQEN